jgi:hypothetical protein
LKLLIKILLILVATSAVAQENDYTYPLDSTDRSGIKYVPTGVRIGADLLGPVLYAFNKQTLSYEFTADIDFDRYYLVAEAGFQQFNELNDNVDYNMTGSFFRIGPDANFLKSDNLLNSFTFGLRYAWASFNEHVVGNVTEPNWGGVPVNFNVDNKSSWVEMTTGMKVRVYKGFFMGYTLRFRFLRQATVPDVPFAPYYVPGYGYADQVSTWGFRYYVYYRFQWAKKPILQKKTN